MEPMVQGVNEAELLLGLPLGWPRWGAGPWAGARVVFAEPVEGDQPHAMGLCRVLRVLPVFSVPAGRALLDLCRRSRPTHT